MSLLKRLGTIVDECTAEYEERRGAAAPAFLEKESFRGVQLNSISSGGVSHELSGGQGEARGMGGGQKNLLALGDNLDFMHWLLESEHMEGRLDLIYIDPPFFSKADYAAEIRVHAGKNKLPQMKQRAYHDTWGNGMEEYLRMLTLRLLFMKDLLKDTGAMWVHLDWHVVHYVKIILDEILGEENFINEVIWTYKSGGVSSRHFARKHDTLLYYAKSRDYYFSAQKEKSYNREYKPYRFKGVEEFEDELGWYTMVNRKDVWQIDMVGRTSSERTGYATQKPEQLLETILASCTREGDLCADFFCGSGTLAAAAEKMGRRWICCDKGSLAVTGTKRRLAKLGPSFSGLYGRGDIKHFTGNGKIRAEISLQDDGSSDTIALTVSLKSYRVASYAALALSEEQTAALKTMVRKDPLSLVDFWTVAIGCGGSVYRPELIICREKVGLKAVAEIPVKREDAAGLTAAVKVWDVFGGCGFLPLSAEHADSGETEQK